MRDFSPGPTWAGDNYPLLRHIVTDLAPQGFALEFGVGHGSSLRILAQHMFTVGFDSFTGLPEPWRDHPAGSFATFPPAIPNTRLVIGRFADTLPRFDFSTVDPLGLVHIDCDLYSSTCTVLEHLGKHLTAGCYVVFDEFDYPTEGIHSWKNMPDEQLAWREFVKDSDIDWDVIGNAGEPWAIRIKG